MKIIDIDKLKVGDILSYKGAAATVTWVREKDDTLTVGVEEQDKSLCVAFDTAFGPVTLTSRIDAKMDFGGRLVGLDMLDYSHV